MSKVTNPNTEISVSCGFFNSGAIGTRKYYASEMSRIFDGIIRDGVFASIGTCFAVNASSGNTVTVGVGKCWFNHTWTENDALLPVDCGSAETLLNRIDAIVVEVNSEDDVQDNFIKVVKGVPAVNPIKPVMVHEAKVNQYALCYIYRPADSTEIIQANITNAVGTEETPFITGILDVISLDELLGQWQDDLDRFVEAEKIKTQGNLMSFIDHEENDFTNWYNEMKTLMEDAVNELTDWTANQKSTILNWFESIRNQLDGDAATNLQNQINESEVKNMLMFGLADGSKNFSEDGTVITSEDSAGRTLTKTFTNNFTTITSVLTDQYGTELGRYVKEISPDGKVIDSEFTLYPYTI